MTADPANGFTREAARTLRNAEARRALSFMADELEALVAALDGQRGDAEEDLYAFMERVSNGTLEGPRHLAPIVELLERAEREPVRAVITTPPQHGKTETIKHAVVRLMGRQKKRNAYVTYQTGRAQEVSRAMQWIAEEAGGPIDGNLGLWRWGGGSLIAAGIGGPLTGYGIDGLLIIDDPVKNRAEAESKLIRDKQFDWLGAVAQTRMHPGASMIVVMTRWHQDDLGGRCIGQLGFEEVRLPAINDGTDPRRAKGEALWEEKRPLAWIEEKRALIGDYDFEALYQGRPQARGATVFGDPAFYEEIPAGPRGYSIGYDLAYTEGTRGDYSAIVVLCWVGGVAYVVEVFRRRVSAPEFKAQLQDVCRRYPGVRPHAFLAGTERGVASFLQNANDQIGAINVVTMTPVGGKLARAQHCAAAWNRRGQHGPGILVPRHEPWVGEFVGELVGFSGVRDKHDDQVDALAGAYEVAVMARGSSHGGGGRNVRNLPAG